jgi:hypothetical protein
MGIETSIAIAIAMAAASAAMSAQAQRANNRVIEHNMRTAQEEATEQQKQVNKQAEEAKGDRTREADREIASLRVLAAEGAGLGSVGSNRLIQEAGFFSGMDIARIESNRKTNIDALQRSKVNGAKNAELVGLESAVRYRGAQMNNAFSAIGSGLQIYSNDQYRQAVINSRKG